MRPIYSNREPGLAALENAQGKINNLPQRWPGLHLNPAERRDSNYLPLAPYMDFHYSTKTTIPNHICSPQTKDWMHTGISQTRRQESCLAAWGFFSTNIAFEVEFWIKFSQDQDPTGAQGRTQLQGLLYTVYPKKKNRHWCNLCFAQLLFAPYSWLAGASASDPGSEVSLFPLLCFPVLTRWFQGQEWWECDTQSIHFPGICWRPSNQNEF